jgi:hypothetical protein
MIKRRHRKRIDEWYRRYKDPPLHAVRDGRDHYAGLWISPWYRFPRRQPPPEVFRAMLDALSRMYDDWERAFSEADIPCDLQLRVYDEHMTDSRLVCAGVEKPGMQGRKYFTDCPEQYMFQYGKYPKGEYFDPHDFDWTTYEVRSRLYEKSDGLGEGQMRRLRREGWREETGSENHERCFSRIYDFVWVGRKKNSNR